MNGCEVKTILAVLCKACIFLFNSYFLPTALSKELFAMFDEDLNRPCDACGKPSTRLVPTSEGFAEALNGLNKRKENKEENCNCLKQD